MSRLDDVIIRPGLAEDAEALSALGRKTFVETFVDGFGIPYPPADLEDYLESSFGVAATAKKLAEPGAAWWVAERANAGGGELLAFANAGPNGLPHPDATPANMELRRLYVGTNAQGLGLGTTLLKLSLEWMEAETDGPLWIGVWSGNVKAQRLYEAYGFSKAGEYLYPVGGWRDHEFILKRG
ncbi:MAG: GNAT family N-acetyltransferase [Caulobacteraceae bacterium]|nr:GNAT family N-acetyltransferase [Caulobacteraceae bacterium]